MMMKKSAAPVSNIERNRMDQRSQGMYLKNLKKTSIPESESRPMTNGSSKVFQNREKLEQMKQKRSVRMSE